MEIKNPVASVVDAARTVKEVLPQTTEQADGAISTLVGWFNNVVLYPVKKANITYQYKLECFEEDLYARTDKIPSGCIHSPDLMIAGPTLEALKYTFDEKELREMYLNLLASSMDSRKETSVHPSYVQVIQQMNSFDAVLFKYIVQNGRIKAINPDVRIKGTNQAYVNALPEWYISYNDSNDIFQISASLVRLSKLGLIELMFDRTAGKDGYDELENSAVLQEIVQQYQTYFPEKEVELSAIQSIIYVNDYGKQFADTCL